MVQRKGHFEAIDGHLPLEADQAGVVDQDVEPAGGGLHLVGQSADLGLRREVSHKVFDVGRGCLLSNLAGSLRAGAPETVPRRSPGPLAAPAQGR